MTIVKTWATVHFNHGKATIEATLNYSTNSFSITHGCNDQNVTFGNNYDDIETAIDRAKCVISALKYIKQELFQ